MEQEKIQGIITKIKFQNDNGFYIFELQDNENNNHIILGFSLNLRVGEFVKVLGKFEIKKGNKQFSSSSIESIEPTTTSSILQYLSSGIIKGIGKTTAEKIVDVFGEDSLKVIDKYPERLLRIPKLGQSTLTKIINSWAEVKPSHESVNDLIKLGFKNFEATKIYKKFGEDSIKQFNEYPYLFSQQIKGLKFLIVDNIAMKNNFPFNSPLRIRATIRHFINLGQENGDCMIPIHEIFDKTYKYLNNVHVDDINKSLHDGIKQNIFHVIEDKYIQTDYTYNLELELAKRILNLKISELNIEKNDDITFIDKKIPFTDEQKYAIKGAIENKVSVITGKPGVGKTTVLKEIIAQFRKLKKDILLCAPTGRAAQKMSQSTGREAATIHRLLEYNPMKDSFMINENNPLKIDVIVIDEASMIDLELMVCLFRALPDSCQVVIIGDIGQLPSVSYGAVLRDIIYSEEIPVFRIEQIQRQKGNSFIVVNAHKIDQGLFDYFPQYDKNLLTDFYFINSTTDENTLSCIENMIKIKIPKTFKFDSKNDVQILTATHEGDLGTKNLNKQMQEWLNTSFDSIKSGFFNYKKNDKVIQTVNNYDKEIFNGDTGTISEINDKYILVDFDNGKSEQYTIKEMNQLLPAYAITGHKSQGSEYPVVIIPLPSIYCQVIDRSWIYTVVTRAKSLVILIGNREVLKRGILSEKSRHRKTNLKQKIIDISKKISEFVS